MIPALAAVFSKLNGLACFLAPLLPTPQVGYADHPFSCAVSCAQLAQRACDGDDGRSAGCRGGGSGRAAGGREGGWGSCSREVIASFS